MTRPLSLLRASLLALALAFAAGGCSTTVSVDPQTGGPLATYRDGTLSGVVPGDPMQVFAAANKALDDQGYTRTGQRLSDDKTNIEIIARAIQDFKIVVRATPGKDPGTSNLTVTFGDGDLPKSQAIYAGIVRQLNRTVPGTTVPPGYSAPSRP